MKKVTKRVWVYVAGSFYIHLVGIGFPQSFGLLFVDLIDYFNSSRMETSLISSLMIGLQLLLGPIAGLLVSRFGSRKMTVASSVLACCACVASYMANSILYLCLTCGAVLGIAFSHLIMSAVIIVNQYFEKRRSLANSLGSLGGGVGTLIFPPLLRVIMTKYTWRGAILITGGIVLNCAVFGALFRPLKIKKIEDLQEKREHDVCSVLKTTFSVFRNKQFITFTFSGFLGALAYLIPFNHIPDHVRDLSISQNEATWIISVIGISGMFGRVFFGWVSDFECINRTSVYAISSIMCGAAILLIPHLTTYLLLMVCAAVFGMFLGVWMSIQPVVVIDIVGGEKIGAGVGFLTGCQGIALFLGSPFAGWLYDVTGNYVISFYVAGSMFCAGGAVMLLYNVASLFKPKVNIEQSSDIFITRF